MMPLRKAMILAMTAGLAMSVSAVEITHTQIAHTQTVTLTDELPRSIRIFTAHGAEVTATDALMTALREANVRIEYHPVDELAQAEAALNASLPRDMADAERLMKERIANGTAMDQEIQRGWMSVFLVRQFQIRSVPAVVFDESQVVYGESDLGMAIQHYQAHREAGR